MKYDQNTINALQLLMMMDTRLQVHTLTVKNDGSYKHNEKKCPMCQSIEILKSYPQV